MQKSIYEKMENSEREVAKYLTDAKIVWQFEKPLTLYDIQNRVRTWEPDFYLPQLGIYLEVCGSENFNYKYRVEVYKKNKIPVIFIHRYKNRFKWQKYLFGKIIEIHEARMKVIERLARKANGE